METVRSQQNFSKVLLILIVSIVFEFLDLVIICGKQILHVVRSAIWHHLYNLKNVKNTNGEA